MSPLRLGLLAFMLLCGGAAAAPADAQIRVAGLQEPVFVHRRDACEPLDIPDAPARAFRDQSGMVHLFATHYVNRASVGPSLGQVQHDCRVVYRGVGNSDPAAFDDRAWLVAFWTNDGRNVAALVHNEFQGNLRPSLCPSRIYFKCWYNSLTEALSRDGGYGFARASPALVAGPPIRFDANVGHPVGYFNSSNIVPYNGAYYAMVFADNAGGQRRGVCLLRTADPTRADSWRAWDGEGFGRRLGDPYHETPAQAGLHSCTPVSPEHLKWHVSSLVFHPRSGQFVAVMASGQAPAAFLYSLSPDLLHWSAPQKIIDIPRDPACQSLVTAYPSLLDPASPARNFETIGDRPYLYFTRFHLENCKLLLDRDLFRIPLTLAF